MKNRRFKLNSRRRGNNTIIVIAFLIMLPLLAIYIGLNITERFVMPILNNRTSEKDVNHENQLGLEDQVKDDIANNISNSENNSIDNSSGEVLGEILGFSIYTVQVASLREKSNLDNFINSLSQQRIPNIVYIQNDDFRVYVLAYMSRGHTETGIDRLRKLFNDAYIAEIHTKGREIRASGDTSNSNTKKIVDAINSLIKNVDKQSEAWYNFFEQEGKLDSYIELLKKQQSILQQLSEAIEDEAFSDYLPSKLDLDKMIHFQESNINRSLEILRDTNSKDDTYKLYSMHLDTMFRLVELIR